MKKIRRLSRFKEVARKVAFATPYFPTKVRWIRFVLRRELGSEETWELPLLATETQKMYVVPKTELGQGIFLWGAYEREVALAFRRLLRPGDVVIDVGANIGQYTLIASERVGKSGLVIGIEPCPHVYQRLMDHLHANSAENVVALDCALGAENGEVNLVVIADSNDGMHHVAPSREQQGSISVPMRRLDDAVDQVAPGQSVDVIKIDVEGWEESVFAGCPRLMAQRRPPTIFFESIEEHAERFGMSACRLRESFMARGYDIFGSRYQSWDVLTKLPDPKPINLVAIHRTRPEHVERLRSDSWATAIDKRLLPALGLVRRVRGGPRSRPARRPVAACAQ